jgi:hypothetical protein
MPADIEVRQPVFLYICSGYTAGERPTGRPKMVLNTKAQCVYPFYLQCKTLVIWFHSLSSAQLVPKPSQNDLGTKDGSTNWHHLHTVFSPQYLNAGRGLIGGIWWDLSSLNSSWRVILFLHSFDNKDINSPTLPTHLSPLIFLAHSSSTNHTEYFKICIVI